MTHPLLHRAVRAALPLLAGATLAACGDDAGGADACTPDDGAVACTCDDGLSGTRACVDGALGACRCATSSTLYTYVAVVSTTNAPEALADATPGPDIDAFMLQEEAEDFWATEVVASSPGAVAESFENENEAPDEVLGPNDAIWDSSGRGPCNLLAAEFGGQFHSLGGSGGYVVVRFAEEHTIDPGETVHVWELAPASCGNLYEDDERPDAYVVFLGRPGAALDPPDFDDTTMWTLAGSSGPTGGIVSAPVR